MRNFDLNKHLLKCLLRMTKNLVNIIAEGKIQGKELKQILFEIHTELYNAESTLQEENYLLIEQLFEPRSEGKLPKGICRMTFRSDVPELMFLN